ncbi:MAG: gliding motility-associated C-terminal domain-containing protein, partial [Lewinella sp.]
EYAGACLLSPLLADASYRFQFDVGFVTQQQSPPINISFFGTTNCDYLPFGSGNEAFGCPSNDPNWKKLGEVRVSGGFGNTWVNTSIDISPDENIYAIAIGPDCAPVSNSVSTYYFFDNLLLADQELFELRIAETAHPCSEDFTLSVPEKPDADYQWYQSGVALQGEVFPELTRHYGEGTYQVRIIEGGTCRITTSYEYEVPVYRIPSRIAICQDESYLFGDLALTESGSYVDTFKNQNNCDSIVALELQVIGATYDTVVATVLDGELYEIGDYGFRAAGDYPLTFTSSQGCDSLVLLNLSSFEVFIPTAFSPNGDGRNDIFEPFAPLGVIGAVRMRIFDRWGNLVHEGEAWEGLNLPPAVYVYSITVDFENGTSKGFYGGVTLVR